MVKILMIEDDENSRDVQSRRLKLLGYQVVLAEDGESGVARARTESPDLIIMDLRLPDLSGSEATHLIKSQPETRAIPIIALSAHDPQAGREEALAAGCDDYETKPVDYSRLSSKIEALLKGVRDV